MEPQPIIVGVDGSASSQAALRWAADYADLVRAPVKAILAWEVPSSYGWPAYYDDVDFEGQAGARLGKTIRDALGERPVETSVRRGHPAAALVEASRGAQLLVVGQRGHGAFVDRMLGSVSQHCVHHAHCPVVVMRGS